MTVSPVRRSNRLIWLGRDVDVVGAVQVVPVLAAEEAVALGQDLQHALAPDDRVRVEERLLDAEDEVLLPEAGVVGDVQLLSQRVQLRDRFLLQLSDIHGRDSRRAGPAGDPAGGGIIGVRTPEQAGRWLGDVGAMYEWAPRIGAWRYRGVTGSFLPTQEAIQLRAGP